MKISSGKNDLDAFYESQGRHAKQCTREAILVAIVWIVTLFWVVGGILMTAYVPEAERPVDPELILGMPAWVVWGLWIPWLVLIFVTWGFARFILKDDEPYMDWPEHDSCSARLIAGVAQIPITYSPAQINARHTSVAKIVASAAGMRIEPNKSTAPIAMMTSTRLSFISMRSSCWGSC
jgi:hypothetical protein